MTKTHHAPLSLTEKKQQASHWFEQLRDQICASFETFESNASFKRTPWSRDNEHSSDNKSDLKGGGEISLMHGDVFEKVGVNISTVHGSFTPEFREKIPGAIESQGEFWASGISLVAHMKNPFAPAVHMNTRMISTSKTWFGGGADLTPTFEFEDDTHDFHAKFKSACDDHNPEYYPKFKKWCDEYFYLPHRQEPRGIGGIFYDYLDTDWEKDFAFTKDIGLAFLDIFPKITERRHKTAWTQDDKEKQLIKRGRYVEFNLLHDRGTQFGLKTGGNTEAILMSMPPEAKWP